MAGLIPTMFQGILPQTVKPAIEGNEIKIVITEQEFKEMAFRGIDERVRPNITLKILEGKIELSVRLM